MYFVGDVHGCFETYVEATAGLSKSIQLGDFGLGFDVDHLYRPRPGHSFIRGNHDNPAVCAETEGFLGDFGFLPDEKIYFIGGGFSIDAAYRTMHVDLWPNEELSFTQANQVLSDPDLQKAEIIISHECPVLAVKHLFPKLYKSGFYKPSSTAKLLDHVYSMCDDTAKKWFFGHHHEDASGVIGQTRFVALGCIAVFDSVTMKFVRNGHSRF